MTPEAPATGRAPVPFSFKQKYSQAYQSNTSLLVPTSVLVGVSIPLKKHHDYGNCNKEKYFSQAVLKFGGLVHYYHGRKHGDM